MKKQLSFIILLIIIVGIYFSTPVFKQHYFYQFYINGKSFEQLSLASINDNDQPLYHYLLSRIEDVEKHGGILTQLTWVIEGHNPELIKRLIKEYDIDINLFISENIELLNNTLRQGEVETFDTIVSLFDPQKKEGILKQAFTQEVSLFLQAEGKGYFFIDQNPLLEKILFAAKIEKKDKLLIILLNKASGLAKDVMVKDLLAYGVNPTIADGKGM